MDNRDQLTGVIIDMELGSIDEYSEAAKLWDLEEVQVGKGSYISTLKGIHTRNFQLSFTHRSLGALIKGQSPADCYTFGLILGGEAVTHNGTPLNSSELIVLTGSQEIDFTMADSGKDLTIVVNKDFFDKEFENLTGHPFIYNTDLSRIGLSYITGHRLYTDFTSLIRHLMDHSERLKTDPVFHDNVEEMIVEDLCLYFSSNSTSSLLESEEQANTVRNYIHKNYADDITLQQIYNGLQVNERTIRMAFKKLYGLSPKQYLHAYRLGRIHQALIHEEKDNTRVIDLAYDNGLFHLGRLSRDYKEIFGELPSDTLKDKKVE